MNPTLTENHKCSHAGCGASFGKAQALRMHTVRMHTGKYQTPPSKARAEQLKRKQIYNKKIRQAYWKLGLTSSGKPRKRTLGVQGNHKRPYADMTPSERYATYRDRYYAKGLNAKGQPYAKTKMGQAMKDAFQRRMTSKGVPASPRITDNGLHNIRIAQQARRRREKAAKRRVFVYPPPMEDLPRGEEQAQPQLPKVKVFNFCPHCGEKLNQPTE